MVYVCCFFSVILTIQMSCRLTMFQLREFKKERRISNDKLEEESEEIHKIKKVSRLCLYFHCLHVKYSVICPLGYERVYLPLNTFSDPRG